MTQASLKTTATPERLTAQHDTGATAEDTSALSSGTAPMPHAALPSGFRMVNANAAPLAVPGDATRSAPRSMDSIDRPKPRPHRETKSVQSQPMEAAVSSPPPMRVHPRANNPAAKQEPKHEVAMKNPDDDGKIGGVEAGINTAIGIPLRGFEYLSGLANAMTDKDKAPAIIGTAAVAAVVYASPWAPVAAAVVCSCLAYKAYSGWRSAGQQIENATTDKEAAAGYRNRGGAIADGILALISASPIYSAAKAKFFAKEVPPPTAAPPAPDVPPPAPVPDPPAPVTPPLSAPPTTPPIAGTTPPAAPAGRPPEIVPSTVTPGRTIFSDGPVDGRVFSGGPEKRTVFTGGPRSSSEGPLVAPEVLPAPTESAGTSTNSTATKTTGEPGTTTEKGYIPFPWEN